METTRDDATLQSDGCSEARLFVERLKGYETGRRVAFGVAEAVVHDLVDRFDQANQGRLDGRTHFEECWLRHPGCMARHILQELQAEVRAQL